MSERFKELKAYNVRYMCDECDGGEMLPTGMCYPTNPPMYPHKCTKCSSGNTFTIQYPTIQYKEVLND